MRKKKEKGENCIQKQTVKKKKIKPIPKVQTKQERRKKVIGNKLKEQKELKLKMINDSSVKNKDFFINKIDGFTIEQLKKKLYGLI